MLSLLLKLLFVVLAALWLYRALQPVLSPPKPPAPPSPPAPGPETRIVQKKPLDDEGEYVDYEEIK